MRYLLDSVILIDHLAGVHKATGFLTENSAACALSVITRAEVLAGCDDSTIQPTTALLDHFVTLPVTVEVADLTARFRRSYQWKLPDALQAASAATAGLTLVTRDKRAFGRIKGVEVLVPYRV